MKILVGIVYIFLTLSACSQIKKSNERDVYLGFKLGSSRKVVEDHLNRLENNRVLQLRDENYYFPDKLNEKTFYTTPLITLEKGDTICTELKVLYCDNLQYLSNDISNTKSGDLAMNMQTNDPRRLDPRRLREHIIEELAQKYGQYTSRDTISFDETILEKTVWENIDGLDISLRFRTGKNLSPNPMFVGNSSLTLTYALNPELHSKIFNKKSIY